jgi:hypothetical protein
MVLQAKSKLSKSPNSATLYLPIPAVIAQDSQFPFVPKEDVTITIDEEKGRLIITSEQKRFRPSLKV